MTKEDDYRKSAAETVELARRVPITDKGRLLALAEAWLELADRAHRVAAHHARRARDLPLIRKRLSGGDTRV